MTTTLVLGAARNGKSEYASALLADHPAVSYVVTGPALHDPPDQDWEERVARSRAKRPQTWKTVETTELSRALLAARGPVIIDTLSHWVWQVLDQHDLWESTELAIKHLEPVVDELLVVYQSLAHHVVAISDEVGWGGEPTAGRTFAYREALTYVNTRFSAASNRVHLILGGRVLDLSGTPSVLSPSVLPSVGGPA